MAAKSLARKSIGYEINRAFKEIVDSRVSEIKNLTIDPSGIGRNRRDLEDPFGPFPL